MDSEFDDILLRVCKSNRIAPYDYSKYKGELSRYDIYPYAPYIPRKWNRILVLGESQLINAKNRGDKDYREKLLDACDDDCIFRLGKKEITGQKPDEFIGVVPWDNGFLKLAMLSCFPEFKANQFGISNMVPWELTKDNTRINTFLEYKSISFWKNILPVLKPKYIICSGEIAKETILLMDNWKSFDCKVFNLLPVNSLTRVSKLFNITDLLSRFPEVKKAIECNPKLFPHKEIALEQIIVYATHAVSTIKSNSSVFPSTL